MISRAVSQCLAVPRADRVQKSMRSPLLVISWNFLGHQYKSTWRTVRHYKIVMKTRGKSMCGTRYIWLIEISRIVSSSQITKKRLHQKIIRPLTIRKRSYGYRTWSCLKKWGLWLCCRRNDIFVHLGHLYYFLQWHQPKETMYFNDSSGSVDTYDHWVMFSYVVPNTHVYDYDYLPCGMMILNRKWYNLIA